MRRYGLIIWKFNYYAKDSNWNEIQKNWFSTFFPDGWGKNKILEEVEYAVKNNSGKYNTLMLEWINILVFQKMELEFIFI